MARSPRAGAASRRVGKAARSAWIEPFLAELADTSNVSAAARRAEVTTSQAYELRRRDGEFARRWQLALCEGYDNLEMELLHRLRTGEIKVPAAAKEGAVAFDNATAFRLLAAHREVAARQRATRDSEDSEAVLTRINAKLERMRERTLAARDAGSETALKGADASPE
jgi:hypothetical protein